MMNIYAMLYVAVIKVNGNLLSVANFKPSKTSDYSFCPVDLFCWKLCVTNLSFTSHVCLLLSLMTSASSQPVRSGAPETVGLSRAVAS